MTAAVTIVETLLCLFEGDEEIDTKAYVDWVVSRTPEVVRKEMLLRKTLAGQARESQYTEELLRINGQRGDGKGLTIGSFLAYTLRGTARSYSGKYATALQNALENRVSLGLAYIGRSQGGKSAYYPKPEEIQRLKRQWNIESRKSTS